MLLDTEIGIAVSASLDDAHISESSEGIENLYTRAGFKVNAKYGIFEYKVRKRSDLSHSLFIKKFRVLKHKAKL